MRGKNYDVIQEYWMLLGIWSKKKTIKDITEENFPEAKKFLTIF